MKKHIANAKISMLLMI